MHGSPSSWRTLAQIPLESDGPRGAAEAAAIGQDVRQALAAVHAAGLLHRDVKAQNVMREDGGRIVLMDFGAGLPLVDTPGAPRALIIGTPLYLAPEVLEYGQVSLRSDISSVGVLIYGRLTNDYPVRGQDAGGAHRRTQAWPRAPPARRGAGASGVVRSRDRTGDRPEPAGSIPDGWGVRGRAQWADVDQGRGRCSWRSG